MEILITTTVLPKHHENPAVLYEHYQQCLEAEAEVLMQRALGGCDLIASNRRLKELEARTRHAWHLYDASWARHLGHPTPQAHIGAPLQKWTLRALTTVVALEAPSEPREIWERKRKRNPEDKWRHQRDRMIDSASQVAASNRPLWNMHHFG